MAYFLTFLLSILVVSGCSSIDKAGIKNLKNSHERLKIDDSIRTKTLGSKEIRLLEHQLQPIDYLHKHPDIRGILVNHYMGTGKTYLGIGMAESFPGHPVIILAPRFIESHWKNELALYGVKDPTRYEFIAYDDAPDKLAFRDVSNTILLADEVHT
jgi:hypothetical protein